MLLEQRPPSANWESIALDPTGQLALWVWFRPVAVPNGLILSLPATLFANPQVAPWLAVRPIIMAAGLEPNQVLGWAVNGMSFDAAGGVSPLLDQPLPPPPTGMNLEVTIWMIPAVQPAWSDSSSVIPIPSAGSGQSSYTAPSNVSQADFQMLEAIDNSWDGILQLEARISLVRKELTGALSRITTLNRDLNSDERRTADSRDIQDWSDARRWLRDSQALLSRSVKEIDLGTTSGAGQRHRFEEIYRNHVEPRIPFAGLAQAVNEFETHRKTVQNVLASAQANVARSGRDAEQRANGVLQRIRTKTRSIRR